MDNLDSKVVLELIEAAQRASKEAYCPYSNYNVGACVLTFDDKKYSGCNVENSAYSQTIHAEENAVSTAIADGLLTRAQKAGVDQTQVIKALAVFCEKGTSPWPCCNCRQFLCEFGVDFYIVGYNEKGDIVSKQLKELVPEMFPIEGVLAAIEAGRSSGK